MNIQNSRNEDGFRFVAGNGPVGSVGKSCRFSTGRTSLALGFGMVLLVGSLKSQAGLFMNVGSVLILPETADQAVEFFVENQSDVPIFVAGLSWNLQVADSGPPERGGLGIESGPVIERLDLITGAFFEANHTEPVDAGSVLQFANWTVTTESGVLAIDPGAVVLMGIAYFDTTEFVAEESWDLFAGTTINGPTTFFNALGEVIPVSIGEGRLAVVPEPTEWACFVGLMLGGWCVWRRRRYVTI